MQKKRLNIFSGKRYFIKTPWWLKKIYPARLWSVSTNKKIIYLTFDDGPHPIATPFILDQLHQYQAKATFFCIGKNVLAYPEIYDRIIGEGHKTGNHTNNHLNGWQTKNSIYLADVAECAKAVETDLFRPPYGKLRSSQAKKIAEIIRKPTAKIVMWDVLSGDFDESLSKEKCLENVIENAGPGSIVVFHDSQKAWEKMSFALPQILSHFNKKGFFFEKIE